MKLKSLALKHFRGATQDVTVPFDDSKNLTMVFGENGSGKSTIVDAFSFLCEQSAGSLEDRSSADKDYLVSITGSRASLSVKLSTSVGTWDAAFKSGSSAIQVSPTTGFPSVRILRRAQILRLVDQPPNKRYEALSEYIEIPGVSKCEETLRKAAKSAQDDFDQSVRALQQSQKTLQDLWEAEGKPNGDSEKWAAHEAGHDVTSIQAEKTAIEGLITALSSLSYKRTALEQSQLQQTKAKEIAKNADDQLKKEELAAQGVGRSLIDLLKNAKQFVDDQSSLSLCPVCEQTVAKESLSKALQTRIASMENLATLSKQLSDAEAAVTRADQNAADSLKHYLDQLRVCATALSTTTVSCAVTTKQSAAEFLAITDINNAAYKPAEEKLSQAITPLALALETAKDVLTKTINQHNALVTANTAIRTNRSRSIESERLAKHTKQALEIVQSLRKEFVQEELDSIATEVDRLYALIHPGEKIGGVKLAISKEHQKSLLLTANFYTKNNITPQSLYSESHLDTLGFVVFFALAKKYQANQSVIILDDVVTSVDEHHLDRFIRLLHDEAHTFAHVLVTTHYRPWCDRYRQHRAPASSLHFIELREWTVERGIRLSSVKGLLQELREALAAPDFNRREVANIAGIFLENLLDWFTLKYGCRLPRRLDNNYALKELADAVSQKNLVGLLRVQRRITAESADWQETKLKETIDVIKELSAVRNQVGCHYNFDGSLVGDTDVRSFGQAALDLGELLCCPDHGDLPDRDKSGEYWETKSQLVKLYPLRIPANA